MKKTFLTMVVIAVIAGGGVAYLPFLAPQSSADISSWQKGASFYPNSPTDFSSQNFKDSLAELKATGANYATLIIPYYQSGFSTTDIQPGPNTPTDQSLIDGINAIHAAGLKVMLKPHLDVSNSTEWRANIYPSDRATWFTNYENMLLHLGDIGKKYNVEEICMGTELVDMSTYRVNPSNTQAWIKMIQDLRTHYSGLLTYDANWGDNDDTNETKFIGFWPYLDFIGISGYYDLQPDSQASVASLLKSWTYWNSTLIQPLYNQFHKPILFSEVGYRSVTGGSGQPWNYYLAGAPNQTEQANAYTALFQYWSSQSYFAGVQLWNWSVDPNAGGANDTNYTPQHKLAENVMKQWFGGAAINPPTNPGTTWSVTASGQVAGSNATSTFSIGVTSAQAQSDVVVDIEIHNQNNTKVYQQYFEHQNFAAGQAQQVTISWTPQLAGSYVLNIGTFNSDWSKNYYWNGNALNIAVTSSGSGSTGGGTSTSTPPTSILTPPAGTSTSPTTGTTTANASTDIWWPINGAVVTDIQPFKAMLTNTSPANYTMFWQVDNGQLNQMTDNTTDYPHKEAEVDLSSWHWQTSNNYNINFVSKDTSGTTISQKAVTIKVQ